MSTNNETTLAWNASPEAGTRKTVEIAGTTFAFRYCPPGTFAMGTEKEERFGANETLHDVTLSQGFWFAETPVTQAQYEAVVGTNPSFSLTPDEPGRAPSPFKTSTAEDVPRFPVDGVSWFDAQEFCRRLNAEIVLSEGFAFRLPWEAEWEYAARAGSTERYALAVLPECVNFWGSGEVWGSLAPLPVGSKVLTNAWGVSDATYNGFEWTLDRFGAYPEDATVDPTGPTFGEKRVLRGLPRSYAPSLAYAALRESLPPSERRGFVGFRLVVGRPVSEDVANETAAIGSTQTSTFESFASDDFAASPDSTLAPEPGTRRVLQIAGVEFAFRFCPAGTFTIGSPEDEKLRGPGETQCEVTLTRGYWVAETPVTQAQYSAVVGKNPSWYQATGERRREVEGLDTSDFPVEGLHWFAANDFCRKLNEEAGLGILPDEFEFRLLTEAEWERACRAGTTGPLYADEKITKLAWIWRNGKRPRKVGGRAPNPWGLCDMLGNVWEWTLDWRPSFSVGGCVGYYQDWATVDPVGPATGFFRMLRGGSWRDAPSDVRSAARYFLKPANFYPTVGFRFAIARNRP